MTDVLDPPGDRDDRNWVRRVTPSGVEPLAWPATASLGLHDTAWIHLDRTDPAVQHWLAEESGIPPQFVEALLEPEPRPRFARDGNGLLLVLRTANLNPGADPEDLISVRIWAEPGRIVLCRNRRSAAIETLQQQLAAHHAPLSTSALLALLIDTLVDALGPVMADIDENMDVVEDQVLFQPEATHVVRLGAHRRQVLQLHRYVSPQRDVLARLDADRPGWITAADARAIRESARVANRYLEDLQAARDHGTLLQEELSARLSEHLNRRLYLFTVVASIFIPLTFFTGLLGANAAGIPFAEERWAFAAICFLSLAIAVGQYWFFRWRHLI